MIKLKLDEMLTKRNMSAYALHINSGKRLHQSVISKIKNNDSKALQIETLDLLCELLECQPGELIAYENESATQDVNTQSVNATQNVERATQSVNATQSAKKQKPFVNPELLRMVKDGVFNNSILEIVNSSSDNELLSTVQVAERLNVSRKSVNDYIIQGKLRAVKGKQNHNFVSEADLNEYIKKSQLER
jgi:putative transcriptional regulator